MVPEWGHSGSIVRIPGNIRCQTGNRDPGVQKSGKNAIMFTCIMVKEDGKRDGRGGKNRKNQDGQDDGVLRVTGAGHAFPLPPGERGDSMSARRS